MGNFCQVLISAANKKEADRISESLVAKKLVAGSLIFKGSARYWWHAKIVEKQYYNISAFSLIKNKRGIIREVKRMQSDECPIIAFNKIDGNKEFLDWIKRSVK